MPDDDASQSIPPFADATPSGEDSRPTVSLERRDVKMALDAGFSEDEVKYMFALPEGSEPAA